MPDKYIFSNECRLKKPAQFQQVFRTRKRLFSKYFHLNYAPNQMEIARLGVVASKRNLRLAVQRNRAKRIAKEVFRHNKNEHSGIDLVIIAQPGCIGASKEELRQCLEKLFIQLRERSKKP